MSVTEILLYFLGIPVLLVTVLSLMIWLHKGVHPATYKMSEPWAQTHPPILWAATDEVIGGHWGQQGHGEPEFSVGGGASGKW